MSLVSRVQRSSPRGHQALQEHRLTITYFYQKNKHFQFFFLNCKILIFAQVVHPTPFILKYFIRRHNLFFLLLSGKTGFIYLLITNSLIGFRSCICGVSHWHTLSLPYSEEGVWIEGDYFHLLPAGFSIRFQVGRKSFVVAREGRNSHHRHDLQTPKVKLLGGVEGHASWKNFEIWASKNAFPAFCSKN